MEGNLSKGKSPIMIPMPKINIKIDIKQSLPIEIKSEQPILSVYKQTDGVETATIPDDIPIQPLRHNFNTICDYSLV